MLAKLWAFWNAGERYYLAAGADVHDVWNQLSGEVRTYAHVDGPLTPASYARALKDGHAYVTYGPLVFPDHMFGDQLKLAAGQAFTLGFDLKAVNGLKSVSLIGGGAVVKTLDLTKAGRETHVDFPLTAGGPGWYALTVEDAAGDARLHRSDLGERRGVSADDGAASFERVGIRLTGAARALSSFSPCGRRWRAEARRMRGRADLGDLPAAS